MKFLLLIMFGLVIVYSAPIIASDVEESNLEKEDSEKLTISEVRQALDGKKGAKGQNGQDGGDGGNGGSSWWGQAGDGGNGGDAE